MIDLRVLGWEMILDYLGGPSIITKIPKREAGRSESVVGDMTMEARDWSETRKGPQAKCG